jgi:hypothetical protein
MGVAVIMGELSSYDGTTAVITQWDEAKTKIEFKATINGNKLTISGLTGTLEGFNGTYTKEGSDDDDGSYTGEGATPAVFEFDSTGITIVGGSEDPVFEGWDADNKIGFTITVNGEEKSIYSISSRRTGGQYTSYEGKWYIRITLESNYYDPTNMKNGDTVLISYDGTGYFEGKLKKFTDKQARKYS